MAPATSCLGVLSGGKECSFRVKTLHEPATNTELEKLLNKVGRHSSIHGTKMTALKPSEEPDAHLPRYKFYEKTPTEGFENAEVV